MTWDVQTRTYDEANRALTKTAPVTGMMTFTYDVTTGMTGTYAGYTAETDKDSKGNSVTKVYDKLGRLSEVRDTARSQNNVTSYTYNTDSSRVLESDMPQIRINTGFFDTFDDIKR